MSCFHILATLADCLLSVTVKDVGEDGAYIMRIIPGETSMEVGAGPGEGSSGN